MSRFATMLSALLILVILFTCSFIFRILLRLASCETTSNCPQLESIEAVEPVQLVRSHAPADNEITEGAYDHADHGTKGDTTDKAKVSVMKEEFQEFSIFSSTEKTREFDARLSKFLRERGKCQVQFFMIWIAPAASFGGREFSAMESVFKAHPNGCLVILSKELDSEPGRGILRPFLDRGYRVAALDPDLANLFKNTPGEAWLSDIQSGRKDPGKIPLTQNLSNLMRLAALYKYGGIYLDTDFIVLRDFSTLRNTVGVQSYFANGTWEKLNNAVLVFDKNHPLLYEFMKDFQTNFNGSIWGHNGPELVSRVIRRVAATNTYNFTILPALAFYPVHYLLINELFERQNDTEWAEDKLLQLNGGNETYGIHLWNKIFGKTRIEEGSIIANLISDHCIICQNIYTS